MAFLYKRKVQKQSERGDSGATPAEGGSRSHVIKVGGEGTLPFLHFEGEITNKPVTALEVWDVPPAEWHPCLRQYYGDVYNDTVAWARKCIEEFGADLILLRLVGADPDGEDLSPADCAGLLERVLAAVRVPLIVIGCGKAEKDNKVMPAVAAAAAGENLLLGVATQENYKSIVAACLEHNHNLIAQSPIDINICKQLNILINEMNLDLNRIVIDPTIASLGYGLEYSFSIMERARIGALGGDRMLAMPMIANIGYEVWRGKEANVSEEEAFGWGNQEERAVLWEATTAVALLQAGADILVMRHPQALELARKNIDDLMQPYSYED